MGGWNLKASIFANYYKIDGDKIKNIIDSINSYYNMIVKKLNVPKQIDVDKVREAIKELKGKTLCCWCKKKINLRRDINVFGKKYNNVNDILCHGDILKFLAELDNEKRESLYRGEDIGLSIETIYNKFKSVKNIY